MFCLSILQTNLDMAVARDVGEKKKKDSDSDDRYVALWSRALHAPNRDFSARIVFAFVLF